MVAAPASEEQLCKADDRRPVPLELERLAESPQGLAFEVKIKSPQGASIMTPARARLEAYEHNLLPCLLTSRTAGFRRALLEEELARAREKREGVLADRSCRAGQHFHAAIVKSEASHQRQAEEAAAHRRRLEEALAQKGAVHGASVAKRGARASAHNDAVAEKVQRCHEALHYRVEEWRRRIEAAQAQKKASRSAGLGERLARAHHHNEVVAERARQHQELTRRHAKEMCVKLQQEALEAEEMCLKLQQKALEAEVLA